MRLATIALLALAGAGCASHPRSTTRLGPAAREAILLTRDNLAPGRQCDIVAPSVPLPPIATVLDTAALPDYLRQAGAAADSGYGLFSVRYDSTGRPVRSRLIEATFADSLRRPMEDVVASSLLARGRGAPLAARVRIDLGPTPRYRIGKSEFCPPVLESIGPSPAGVLDLAQGAPHGSTQLINYVVDIASDGGVVDVRFTSSAPSEIEQALMPALRFQRWKPAVDDGLPIAFQIKGTAVLITRVAARPVPR